MVFLDTFGINEFQWELVYGLYKMLVQVYNFLLNLTGGSFFDNVQALTDAVYYFAGIFMLFRISVSLLNYLINPDSISDKSVGPGKLIGKVVISIILIASANSLIFPMLTDLQSSIVSTEDGIIFRVFRIAKDEVEFQSSSDLKEGCFVTLGSKFAASTVKAFIEGNFYVDGVLQTDAVYNKYLETAFSDGDKCNEEIGDDRRLANSVLQTNFANFDSKDEEPKGLSILALGAIIAFFGLFAFVLIMCIDIVVRSLKLLVLQMISPIAFISYISPKDKVFDQWLKTYASVYADLFIKLIAVSFVVELFAYVNRYGADLSGFVRIFYLLGILVFAKLLPDFISKIFGISGMGSFKESANMLKKGLGLGAGAAALAVGAGFASHKANKAQRQQRINNGQNFSKKWKDAKGEGGKINHGMRARALGSSALSALGQAGRAAKMVSTNAIKGAGAGFQGKGIANAFSGAIAEGDNLATAIEGGSTFTGRVRAGLNKTLGTDLGGLSKAKETKEAVDKFNSSLSTIKSEGEKEIIKQNINGIATREMRLQAMEEANNNRDYVGMMAELGYTKEGVGDGVQYVRKTIDASGNEKLDILLESELATAARDALVSERKSFNDEKKIALNDLLTGAAKNAKGEIVSLSPDLIKMSQEVAESANNAKIAGADIGDISLKEKGYLDFGKTTDSDGKEKDRIFKDIKDLGLEVSADFAKKIQTSGAGADRAYVDNKKK